MGQEAEKTLASWGIAAGPGEWVRPLGSMETLMAWGGRHGTFNTVTALWLTSPLPLHPQQVRHALTLLAQEVEVLQLVVSWRWLRLWFQRMKHVKVDFRVDEREVGAVVEGLVGQGYDLGRGPLWRARLVPLDAPPGRYRAVLVLAVHHTITDGLTNMVLSRDLLHLINTTLVPQGPVQILSPPRPIIPALADTLVRVTDLPSIISNFCHKASGCLLNSNNKGVYFGGALPRPDPSCPPVAPTTHLLHSQLPTHTTTALLARCRAAGVTMHAALLAVVQVALVRVARRRGGGDTTGTAVKITNCVNTRRYYPATLAHAPGCHISLEDRQVAATPEDETEIWRLVGRLHTSLRQSLGPDRTPVKNTPLLRFCGLLIQLNVTLQRLSRRPRANTHLVTTNMGDLSDLLPGTCPAGPVQVAHMVRSVSSELAGSPFMLACHTFRGRLLLSLDHYTTLTTPPAAAQLFSCLVSFIACLATHGSLTHTGPEMAVCPRAHHDHPSFNYTTGLPDYSTFTHDLYFAGCEDDHSHLMDEHSHKQHDPNHNQYDYINHLHDLNHNQHTTRTTTVTTNTITP